MRWYSAAQAEVIMSVTDQPGYTANTILVWKELAIVFTAISSDAKLLGVKNGPAKHSYWSKHKIVLLQMRITVIVRTRPMAYDETILSKKTPPLELHR